MEQHGIQVVRDYGTAPAIQVDKHKVLQILVRIQEVGARFSATWVR
jgi:hypothetical protein